MPTVNPRLINGVVRTTEPVWSNLERLAEACTSWFTYDVHTGLYSWVINEAGNVATGGYLDESDIIGPIQISGSGLTNLYNAIEVEYPNTEIRDQPHYVRLELNPAIRNAYEPDNTLQISTEFINNQPQAEYMADITLRQSRLDRTITINMDYTKINLRAGDIIAVTSPTYGWTAKEFRIMRVREIEGDDGSLRLEFNCSEYDDSIYTGDLSEFLIGGPPGIISIGAIGQAGTPVGNIININGVPILNVTSTVPTGIVDRMQFWAGNISITGNVANTAFNLIGTVASTNANALTTNSAAVFSTASLSDGLYAFKARGVNVNGTGPFSNVSANVNWSSANIVANTIGNVAANTTPSNTVIANIANSASFTNAMSIVADNRIANTVYIDVRNWTAYGQDSSVGNALTGFDQVENSANLSQTARVIHTSDGTMFGVNTSNANVFQNFAYGNTIDVRVSVHAVALNSIAPSNEKGAAVYLATAPWNANTYSANGFAGLSWSDWIYIGGGRDELNQLPASNAWVSVGGGRGANVGAGMANSVANGTPYIIAIGTSTTVVPSGQNGDFGNVTDPLSNVTIISNLVPFANNTVIIDSGASPSYQVPGRANTWQPVPTGFKQASIQVISANRIQP